jgi:sulfatase maturation enzyme AslB (radical SAM superfamily)
VDTIILTGIGEVLQNMDFLYLFNDILAEMNHPFPRIELQTSGVLLNDDHMLFLKDINVNTISISVSNLFDNERNMELIDVAPKLRFTVENICELINKYNLNIRLSLNLTSDYNNVNPEEYFRKSKSLGATHVTFRKLYSSANATPEDKWVNEHKLSDSEIEKIYNYIKSNGKALYVLPFGYTAYSVKGISTVLDDNCMDASKNADDVLKYLILRENGKLFTQWDDEGSLIF